MDDNVQLVLKNDEDPFGFSGLTYITTQQESAQLNHKPGPLIVISASGMCESGRIRHHLLHGVEDPRNTILIIGYQALHTLGRRIVERRPSVRIFDRELRLRARVEVLNGLSAHADAEDFKWWCGHMASEGGIGQVFLVHGEPEAAGALARLIHDFCDQDPVVPQLFQQFDM
jgi:metallo-beta-lactamase family protein